jgi:thiol-disulfide isomerase/thioredoxin
MMRRLMKRRAVVALISALAVPVSAQVPSPSPTPLPPLLAPGEAVPAFEAEAIAGGSQRVAWDKAAATVVIFFSSGCPHCQRMLPLWNEAFPRRGKGVQVVGVLTDHEPPGFFELRPVVFPVVRLPNRDLANAFKVSRVPLTVRVGPDGKVVDTAPGEVDLIRLGQLFH